MSTLLVYSYVHVFSWYLQINSSLNVRKRTFGRMRPMNTQICLRIRTVWLDTSFSAWRNASSVAIQRAPSRDADQTARMRGLICILAGHTYPKLHFLKLRLVYVTLNVQNRQTSLVNIYYALDTLTIRTLLINFTNSIWIASSETVAPSVSKLHILRFISRMRKVSSGHLLSIDILL